jgi:hypothetical protein
MCCDAQATSAPGHFRPIDDVRAASALPPIATESLHCGNKHNGADIVWALLDELHADKQLRNGL